MCGELEPHTRNLLIVTYAIDHIVLCTRVCALHYAARAEHVYWHLCHHIQCDATTIDLLLLTTIDAYY